MTLLNSLSSSRNFFKDHMEFSTSIVMPLADSDSFISSLLFCVPFILFSCLTPLVITSSTSLNSSSESRHPCLVLTLEKSLSLSALSMMLIVGFLEMVFIKLRIFPFIPSFLWAFVMNECWHLLNVFLHQLIYDHNIIFL